ncbi:hypothetical protein LZ30DRAFT_666942 [Colletotrichum cereale]|nr:hypothetical protein LZ30DRAFT_666942 [Colletotrichum cereale]
MLAKTVLLATLGAFASAQTFVGYPKSLTCKTASGPVDISATEYQKAIVGPQGLEVEKDASNIASGKCSTLSGIPLFSQRVDGKGTVSFAYDKAKDTYHFCNAQGTIIEKGFPSPCTEN